MFGKVKAEVQWHEGLNGYPLSQAHDTDAGYDIALPKDFKRNDAPMQFVDFDVVVNIPPSHFGLLTLRSSISKKGALAQIGIIDSGYTGTIKLTIHNLPASVKAGDRVAQIIPVGLPDLLMVHKKLMSVYSERGSDGFGSSGK